MTEKIVPITFVALILTGAVTGSFHEPSNSFESDQDNYFSIPEYDSHREIATQLVAPFLFITILLQIGLERALYFTLDTNDAFSNKKEKKKAKKQATIISLLIAAMMIPTPIFRNMDLWVAVVFGGGIYILMAILGIAAVLFLWRRL